MALSTDVLIVGGGLSGLTAAHHLIGEGISVQVLEASGGWGGRIRAPTPITKGTPAADSIGHRLPDPEFPDPQFPDPEFPDSEFIDTERIDVGPIWFWSDQPTIATLIDQLGLQDYVFEQQHDGLSLLEYADGSVQRTRGAASMAGSYRLQGGLTSLIKALCRSLPTESLHGNRQVTRLSLVDETQVHVMASDTSEAGPLPLQPMAALRDQHASPGLDQEQQPGTERVYQAQQVILALPPRIVGRTIQFDPPCTEPELLAMRRIPTWMAGQAKGAVVLAAPLWRDQGLSGDALSRVGPLVELHDASPPQGPPYVLSGFIGLSVDDRQRLWPNIEQLLSDQIIRLLGISANDILSVHAQDWSQEPLIATVDDWQARALPTSPPPQFSADHSHRVLWAGSESATRGGHSCGFMEGAVEAGLTAAKQVMTQLG